MSGFDNRFLQIPAKTPYVSTFPPQQSAWLSPRPFAYFRRL